ncbi:MAG: M15 family metallopeptidase [Syntrophomonadaceae bacterium]
MKKKRSWIAAVTVVMLIVIGGLFYYLDKPYGQNEKIAADSTTSQELINNPSTSPASQNALSGGTSPESQQAADHPNGLNQDAAKEQQDSADSTYDKGSESNKPGVSQTASDPGQTAREGQENVQALEKTTVVDNPSRSGSIYNRLSPSKGIYGQFRYRDIGGGRIEIDPQWVAQNIVTITLPGLNRNVQVNRAAKDKFIKAFNYIKNGTVMVNGREVSLLSLIKTMDGTFVSRHVNWNSSNGLSNHSWGTAIDINASSHFGYVSPGETDDPNLILWEKAFKPAGFSWGNSYSDSMHFELLN